MINITPARIVLSGIYLVCAWTFCLNETLLAQNPMTTNFIPNPNNDWLVAATEEWLIWKREEIVKGTEGSHVPKMTHYYYVQRNIEELATLAFQETGTIYTTGYVNLII
jgi:hypothetical protein